MCTLTYIPYRENGFILTHNRDEKLTRQPSDLPKKHQYKNTIITCPKDLDAKGTWFGQNEKGLIVCVLNGAFEKHVSIPPYRKSRGIVVMDALASVSVDTFIAEYDLEGIENFTMILLDKNLFYELIWDGNKKFLKKLSPTQTHIWSSVTLYTEEQRAQRKSWLNTWLTTYKPTPNNLLSFHENGGENNKETRLRMAIKGSHQTVSITQVHDNKLERWMNHINFVTNKTTNTKI